MLNGKFFTGLPPKMIDRGGAAANRNRLESHFFWPDDTKVETAVDCRIKRRNSVLDKSNERPIYEKQSSVAEVDTKKRFSKEFSQSSIQFYDNLNEGRTNSRKPMTRKMEITEKPTNTKIELPESVVDEAYTTAKKKQAYTSKIEFFDYVNDGREEPQTSRNNIGKLKMDMNDKREMELNSKNSPKLQMKRDVRSLSEEKEQRKINNREIRKADLPIRDNYIERERERISNNDDRYLQSRRAVEPKLNKSPQRNVIKPRNDHRERFSYERESFRELPEPEYDTQRRNLESYEYADERLDYDKLKRRIIPEPRSTPKHNTRDYYDGYEAEQEILNRMRSVHLKSPTRQQYYPPEEYYNDEPDNYYDQTDQIRTPTKRGNSQRNNAYNDREEYNVADLPYENSNVSQRLNNQIRNNTAINRINNHIEKQVAPSSSTSTPDIEVQSAMKPRKHLRSSLCFNDGAIVANNNDNDYDELRSPTSTQNPTPKRNARSSATQRVSVGLPD